MRGAVTIAAALLIPLHTDDGAPLPGRDLIVFFAFAVVLARSSSRACRCRS